MYVTTMCMKKRYNHTIYCSESFKKKIDAVCGATDMSPADLVKSVFLFSEVSDFDSIVLEDKDDKREKILVKTGASAGKVVSRRPRIQIILPFKISPAVLKKALTLAIQPKVKLTEFVEPVMTSNISIDVGIQPDMIENISTIREALHILGFAPRSKATKAEIKGRYRTLLKAYHSDTGNIFASSERLNAVQRAWKVIDKSM